MVVQGKAALVVYTATHTHPHTCSSGSMRRPGMLPRLFHRPSQLLTSGPARLLAFLAKSRVGLLGLLPTDDCLPRLPLLLGEPGCCCATPPACKHSSSVQRGGCAHHWGLMHCQQHLHLRGICTQSCVHAWGHWHVVHMLLAMCMHGHRHAQLAAAHGKSKRNMLCGGLSTLLLLLLRMCK